MDIRAIKLPNDCRGEMLFKVLLAMLLGQHKKDRTAESHGRRQNNNGEDMHERLLPNSAFRFL